MQFTNLSPVLFSYYFVTYIVLKKKLFHVLFDKPGKPLNDRQMYLE